MTTILTSSFSRLSILSIASFSLLPEPLQFSMTAVATLFDFTKDPESDVVLRLSDLCDFPFRRLFLQSGSPVFEDMFEGVEVSTGLRD